MVQNLLDVPVPKPLPGESEVAPYVLVADDAFPLKTYIMKLFPFRNLSTPQRIFNYRLSRARRIIENVFGIAAARFRILRKPIDVEPAKVIKIVLAICALHNFLVTNNGCANKDVDHEVDGQMVPGLWRRSVVDMEPTPRLNAGRPSENAVNVRLRLMNHFQSDHGSVPWQINSISRLD